MADLLRVFTVLFENHSASCIQNQSPAIICLQTIRDEMSACKHHQLPTMLTYYQPPIHLS